MSFAIQTGCSSTIINEYLRMTLVPDIYSSSYIYDMVVWGGTEYDIRTQNYG